MDLQAISRTILPAYGIPAGSHTVRAFGTGLIHATLLVEDTLGNPAFILQRVNDAVFRQPPDIAANLALLGTHLARHHPDYLLPLPMATRDGRPYARPDDAWWRIIPYVPGTHAIDVCSRPEEAFEAAQQFGTFTSRFEGMDVSALRDTIPSFHDLSFRWRQFMTALHEAPADRMASCETEVKTLRQLAGIVDTYERIRREPAFRRRVTHHDTKISNVLFDQQVRGVCVIDLDTVMAGYTVSDLGDMFRTYLSPLNEESADFASIHVRRPFREAIREGYLERMADLMSDAEHRMLDYAGEFMIYMQALRFLTDHLNGNVYYGAAYPGQNLVRARNQIALLTDYQRSLR
jgi:Ser/Thr protein kinase RdoA (MazF antagonist)